MLAAGLRLAAPRPLPMPLPPPGAEAVEFPSETGLPLRGWWMPGEPGAGAVVLLHGAWESRLRMRNRAERLRAEGFSVLLFDFQAHGESPGDRITFGAREALDARAALAFVRGRLPPGERVGAIGFSLGGAAVLLAGPPWPDAVVLEAVFASFGNAVRDRLRARLGALPAAVLTPAFRLLAPLRLGAGWRGLRPVDRIGEVPGPVLILSGAEDARTRPEEARALFDAARGPKRLVLVPGAGHLDLERQDPPAYWAEVLPFLRPALRAGG